MYHVLVTYNANEIYKSYSKNYWTRKFNCNSK